jgi:hypothetical protein
MNVTQLEVLKNNIRLYINYLWFRLVLKIN